MTSFTVTNASGAFKIITDTKRMKIEFEVYVLISILLSS